MGRPWMHHPGLYAHHPWLGALLMLIVIAMIVAGAILIARSYAQRSPTSSGSAPLRILEERYARGEIDEDEFRKRREVLRG